MSKIVAIVDSYISHYMFNIEHILVIFKKWNILDIFKLNTHCICIFMYIYSRNLLPECLTTYLFRTIKFTIIKLEMRPYIGLLHACRANIIYYPTSCSENIELSSFINNRNKYHFLFQTKIAKIFHWKQLVHVHVNRPF